MKGPERNPFSNTPVQSNLDASMHSTRAFARPHVIEDEDHTVFEKRAAFSHPGRATPAVEAAPALRQPPAAAQPLPIDEVLHALRSLECQAERLGSYRQPRRRPPGQSFPGRAGTRPPEHAFRLDHYGRCMAGVEIRRTAAQLMEKANVCQLQ